VVRIIHDIDEICAYLGEQARPAWGEPFEDIVKRREPWFVEVASHEFVSYTKVLRPPNALFIGRPRVSWRYLTLVEASTMR